MNGMNMKIRMDSPSCNSGGGCPVAAGPDSRPTRCFLSSVPVTRPGISAQNHPNRLASGRATRNARGARSQVRVNVKASAEEIFRYEMAEVNCLSKCNPTSPDQAA